MALTQLSQADLQLISEAVSRAEQHTGGEIVPVLADSSDFYEAALWRAGAVNALVTGLILTAVYLSSDALLFLPPYLWLLCLLAAGSGAMALAADSWLFKRMFLSRKHRHERVLAKAKAAFHDYGVHCTEQHTGVLIYVSFFEREVVILADAGIAELVPEGAWDAIVCELTQGLRAKRVAASVCEAVERCGALLAESGIQKPEDDGNELTDEVRIHD